MWALGFDECPDVGCDNLSDASDVSSDDWCLGGHCFEVDLSERFHDGGHDKYISVFVVVEEFVLREVFDVGDLACEVVPFDERLYFAFVEGGCASDEGECGFWVTFEDVRHGFDDEDCSFSFRVRTDKEDFFVGVLVFGWGDVEFFCVDTPVDDFYLFWTDAGCFLDGSADEVAVGDDFCASLECSDVESFHDVVVHVPEGEVS